MADYGYTGVLDDEEELKKPSPYPPVQVPMRPAATPDVMTPPEMPAKATATPAPISPTTSPTPPPPPSWKEYAPPERHGWSKFGSALAAINPTANRIVNEAPEKRAEQRYANATNEYKEQLGAGERARTEASQAELRHAQAQQDLQKPATAEEIQRLKNEGALDVQGAKGGTAETIATGKNKTAEDIAGGKEKSAETIAKERAESNERIATGHNLAMTEAARLRTQMANDPNKLTVAMKNMKQQAQATLPGIERALDETEKVHGLLGPGAGRWNDFWTGKVGGGDPAYKHYKDEIGMIQSAVTLAHARGRISNQLFDHFQQMFDAGKLSPENMVQALNVAHEWLGDYANMGEPGSPVGNAVQPQGGGAFKAPTDAPVAPKEDGKVLKKDGKIIAVSKGGAWQAPAATP